MTMRKRLTQLQALTADDWRVLLVAMLLLPLIALALRLKGFKWTQALLSGQSKSTSPIPADDQAKMAQSIARMVAVAANHGPYRANCLKKSLVTWWLLEHRGIVTELKIGVNKEVEDFNAHAWVECQGKVLNESDDVGERFSAFGSHRDLYG